MYDARVVANEILRRAWDCGVPLTQIQLQKITYFLHGHHLVDHGELLVETEFEAMDYGPVQRLLLETFRRYKGEPIEELAEGFDPIRRVFRELPRISDNLAIDTIEKYLSRYLEIPAFSMVDMTHEIGTPWAVTMQGARNVVNVGMRIKNELIQSKFEGLREA